VPQILKFNLPLILSLILFCFSIVAADFIFDCLPRSEINYLHEAKAFGDVGGCSADSEAAVLYGALTCLTAQSRSLH
jgi:hypothetical protein